MGCDQYTPGFIHSALKELGINISLSSENNFGIGGCWLSRGGGRSDSMVERYTQIPDCDVLTIMGGMNDGKAPYSTWQEKIGTSESVSTDTYWGALKAIIEGWQTLHPNNNTTIILMTYPSHLNYPEKKLINQAIRDCAELYGLPLVDFERNCGFKGHLQSEQSRNNLVSDRTFKTGYLSVNDGKTIVSSQSANKYCEDYIEINTSAIKSLWANTNNVIYYYSLKDGVYTYLGYENYGGGKIPKEVTHIRVGGTASASMDIRVMDGQYISDGVHPNVLGFAKMAPILASKLREICWWRFVDEHTRR